jgi:hypothetical protein
MGSYISIENNTQKPWVCKMQLNQDMITAFGLIATALGTALLIFTASTAGIVLAFSGAMLVVGIPAALAGALGADSPAFIEGVSTAITDDLVSKGFQSIAPSEKHRWGKMTLSLIQQATCVTLTTVDERTVIASTVIMKPLFSGPTDNSVNYYNIQNFVTAKGVENTTIKAEVTDSTHRMLESGTDKPEVFYIFSNGTVRSQDGNLMRL